MNKKLSVGILGDCFVGNPSGMANYVKNLINACIDNNDIDITLIVPSSTILDKELSSFKYIEVKNPFPFFKIALWNFFIGLFLKYQKQSFDIIFSTQALPNLPILQKRYGIFLYDLTDITNWELSHMGLKQKVYKDLLFKLFLHRYKVIITCSEYSKIQICTRYPKTKELIHVAYPLVLKSQNISTVNKKYPLPYFLIVGCSQPRKNIPSIIKAFEQFKKNSQSTHELLIVGDSNGRKNCGSEEATQSPYSKNIKYLGHVDNAELLSLYKNATAILYCSLEEGFGIPIIEAFSHDCPVITSNISSMSEVAGDSALLVNPYKIEDITAAMVDISSDKSLRQSLIEKGRDAYSEYYSKQEVLFSAMFKKIIQLCK